LRVVAVIQARMGSSRLPGKSLRPLVGVPMIGRVVERARRIPGVDEVRMAIPDLAEDDDLAEYLSTLVVGLTRGSETDVLDRFARAAREAHADVVMRLTGDCPLLSPGVSGRVLAEYLERRSSCDYASNTLERSFPRGLDTEVFSRSMLSLADREATAASDREHVTPFLWRQPERFRLHAVVDAADRSSHRWTVDTEEDFELVRRLYTELEPRAGEFEYDEVLDCLDRHPEWSEINREVRQKSISEETPA
jgi:spore coat polysaccharide biosynthesis protein SpsF